MIAAAVSALFAACFCWLIFPVQRRPTQQDKKIKKTKNLRFVSFGVAGALFGYVAFGGVVAAAIGAVVSICVLTFCDAEKRQKTKRRQELREQLPSTLELLASCLSSGAPVSQAVREVAEISPPATADLLNSYCRNLDVGRSQIQAWKSLAKEPVWEPVATDISALVASGSAMSKLLLTHAKDAREACASELETAAKTLAVKSVLPLMCCFLPSFILVGVVPIIAGVISSGIL